MGDAYDEDDDRLMIDDAMLDTGIVLDAQQTSNSVRNTNTSTSAEKTIELSASCTDRDDEGVESHPVDPEPNLAYSHGPNVLEMTSNQHHDDRLKMTIKRTQTPPFAPSHSVFSEHECPKEEGELDDEDEASGNGISIRSCLKSPAVAGCDFKNSNSWQQTSKRDRDSDGMHVNYEAKFGYTFGSQKSRGTNLSMGLSHGVQNTASSPSCKINANVLHHGILLSSNKDLRSMSPSRTPQKGDHNSSSRDISSSDITESSEVVSDAAKRSVGESVSYEVLVKPSGSSSSTPCKTKKRKRRTSGANADEKDSMGESATGVVSVNSAAALTSSGETSTVSFGSDSVSKRRRANARDAVDFSNVSCDKETCVHSKSIQTFENDIEVKVGMNYCLDFSVLAKVSNTLYFVTNWNGHELYGILGDGLSPMQHNCANRKSNRSSSVCPSNGYSDGRSHSKKNLCLALSRPASASTSDGQSLADMFNDEETSQSPVSWMDSGGGDPLFGVGVGSIGTSSGLIELRETNSNSGMLSCPVSGCNYHFETHASMVLHQHDHFNKTARRAIFVENMGSQTDSSIIGTKTFREVGTDPDPELSSSLPLNKATTSVATETSPNLGSVKCEAEAAKPNEISGNATRMQLTSTLSNSEEQSISELFQVITRKTDKNDCSANDDRLKDNGGSEKKAGIKKNDLMEVKRLGDPRTTNSLAETDALLQMTNPKASSRSSNVSSCSVPTSLLPCIPDQFTHVSTAAASPVFSDISDDAPTLEKEVSDKGDERVGSERMRSTNSSSLSTLGALRPHQKERTDQCISMVSDKVDGSTASSDNLADPSALLCPSAASSLTTTANNPSEPVASVSSETTGTPSEVNKRASEVSSKPVPVINNPLSSYAGVTGPSAMSPFIGIDPTFGLRAASGGIPVSLTGMSAAAAMMYSPQLMMSYGSPSAVPSASVPQAATLPANTISKHKIHDLKASCSPSISSSRESSQGVPKSSMLTSPVGRPQSSGSSGGLLNGSLGSANLSNSHKHGSSQLNPGSANSRSSSTATSLSSMQPTTSTTSSISGGAQAMNIMQQQQQAQYVAQMQQQQHMQLMQSQMRYAAGGAPFPMMTPATSVAAAAAVGLATQQAVYEQQLAAMQTSFPGFFVPHYPPK